MIARRLAVLAATSALASFAIPAGCAPGPEPTCELGSERPRCPPSSESWWSTRYEAVCGHARTDCSAGVQVVAPNGRPSCDPAAPELGAACSDGSLPYCHFADCRAH
jgi:hypothetical protein